MPADEGKGFLESLLRVTVNDLQRRGEDVAFRQLETALGIVLGNGIRFALGPVGFVLPIHTLLTWGTRMVYAAAKDWQKGPQPVVGTVYNVRTTKSGLLIAENQSPSTLRAVALPLPKRVEVPLPRLVAPPLQSLAWSQKPTGLTRIDGAKLFRELWSVNRGVACSQCGQAISRLGSLELGHAAGCPQNRFRPVQPPGAIRTVSPPAGVQPGHAPASGRPCILCGQPLVSQGWQTAGHTPNCILNPQRFGVKPITSRSRGTVALLPRARILSGGTCFRCGGKGWIPSANPTYRPFAGMVGSVGMVPCPSCRGR